MDNAEYNDAEDDWRGLVDNEGEWFEFRPHSNKLFALKLRVQKDASSVHTEADEAEGEQHNQVHCNAACDSREDGSRVRRSHSPFPRPLIIPIRIWRFIFITMNKFPIVFLGAFRAQTMCKKRLGMIAYISLD